MIAHWRKVRDSIDTILLLPRPRQVIGLTNHDGAQEQPTHGRGKVLQVLDIATRVIHHQAGIRDRLVHLEVGEGPQQVTKHVNM